MSSTSNSTSGLNSVPMHDGSNHIQWAAGMKAYLRFAKLWPYVEGTKMRPSNTSSAEYDAWNELDEQAIGTILMKLPYQYHHLAVDSAGKDRFSEQLWEAIETQFGKTGTAGIFSEFISAIHFTVREGEEPIPVLGNLTAILQRMVNQNIKLDDKLQVLLYLAALPRSWESFKTSVLTTASLDNKNWTVSSRHAMIAALSDDSQLPLKSSQTLL